MKQRLSTKLTLVFDKEKLTTRHQVGKEIYLSHGIGQ